MRMGRGGRPRKRQRSCGDDEAAAAGTGAMAMAMANDDDDEDPAYPSLFPVGTDVEVRSDDPGFIGSYYEATVVGCHPSPSGLGYVVDYSTLTRRPDGDGGSPLRELADAANVRPRPPPHPQPPDLAVHDMVDAFHNGGWWAGVVVSADHTDTGAPPTRSSLMYKVCFPTSRELLDFHDTALRPSRVFLQNHWVPAAHAENGTPLFREGCQVEVSHSKKIFGKYWSPATILKVIGASTFLVQYTHVREDGELVTEILDSQYIRPTRDIVHMDSKYRFPPSSHVEVFHEGSWWPGVILNVLDTKSTKKYVVKINSHEADKDDVECIDSLTVDHTQLRPQYDWYHGKWVRRMTAKPVNKGPKSRSRKRPVSSALTLCNDSVDIAGLASYIDNDSFSYESGTSLMETYNKDVVLEPICPDLVSNENDPTKHKKSTYSEKVVKQQGLVLALASESRLHTNHETSTNPEEVVKQQGTILSFESRLRTKHETSTNPEQVVKQQGTIWSFESRLCTNNETSTNPEEVVKQQGTVLWTESRLTLPSQSSATGFGNLKYDPKLLSDQLEGSSSQMMAKPSGLQAGQLQASLFGAFGTLRPLPVPQTPCFRIPSHTIDFGSIVGSNNALTYQQKQSSDGEAGIKQKFKFGSFSAFKNLAGHEEHGMSRQGHTSAMVRHAAEGSQSIEDSEITQLSCIGTSDSTEAQPGDTLLAPKDSEGTPMSKFVPSRKHGRSRNVGDRPSESSVTEDLPFVKTSPLWAQIEAMEVFRKVPQRPNFDKYQQHVPELREGMALGLMLSFANLAESVKRLCIEDDDAVFDEKMKGVSLLEADGFDVEHLRSRLEMLRRIKNGRAKLQGALKDLEEKISHEETQRHALNLTVRQLELQAYLLRCIMRSAISQKISDASEILRLKTQVSELEQRFSSATASPW